MTCKVLVTLTAGSASRESAFTCLGWGWISSSKLMLQFWELHFEKHCPRLWNLQNLFISSQALGARLVCISSINRYLGSKIKFNQVSSIRWVCAHLAWIASPVVKKGSSCLPATIRPQGQKRPGLGVLIFQNGIPDINCMQMTPDLLLRWSW